MLQEQRSKCLDGSEGYIFDNNVAAYQLHLENELKESFTLFR